MALTLKEFQSRGGKTRASRMTHEQRVAAARKAALARWSKRAPHYTTGAPAPEQKGQTPV